MLSALSVKTAVLVKAPILCGSKLMLRLQVAPGVSEKVLLQSAGVPEPVTWRKFGPVTTSPGATAANDWLPMFWTITDCGLSLLVPPGGVDAKLKLGTCESCTSTTLLLPASAMKTSPAPSTAIASE